MLCAHIKNHLRFSEVAFVQTEELSEIQMQRPTNKMWSEKRASWEIIIIVSFFRSGCGLYIFPAE